MGKWKSDPVKGWVPVNEGAELTQAKRDLQDGKITPADLKAKESQYAAKVDAAQVQEREKVKAEGDERAKAHAAEFTSRQPKKEAVNG